MGFDYPTACNYAKLSMAEVARFKRTDPAFDRDTRNAEAVAARFVLGRLMGMIRDGNLEAIRYYLETRTVEFAPGAPRKPAKDPTKPKERRDAHPS